MLHQFIEYMLSITEAMGYWGIVALMSVESSFIPFPSEVVIPPAAYLSSIGEMNIYLVVIFGILGSLIGATINYFLALYFGRKIIYKLSNHRIAKLLLINPKKIEIAENHFLKYGAVSTFFGRLLPAVRQLISIPAGFSKMHLGKFLFFTFLGSGTWTIVLALFGYYFYSSKELFEKYYGNTKMTIIFIVLILIGYFIYKFFKNKNTPNHSENYQK